MISVWSVLSASLWFALDCLLLMLLRKHTNFLIRYGTAAWSLATALTVVRLLLPLDCEYMVVLRSYRVLPALQKAMAHELAAGVTVERLLVWIWLGGSLVGVARVAWGMRRDDRRLGAAVKAPHSRQVEEAIERCGVPAGMVHVTPVVTTPVAVGFLHPAIYLPDWTYADGDLDWILKHEMAHLAGHDPWLRLGFLLFRCIFWWNPMVHVAQLSVNEILELRCDKTVLTGIETVDRLSYVEALCRAGRKACPSTPRFTGAGAFVQPGKVGTLALRVHMALKAPAKRDKAAMAAMALSVALFSVSYLFILQPAGFPKQGPDEPAPIYVVSPGTSYLKKRPSGEYELWCDGQLAGTVSADMLRDEMFSNIKILP